MENFTIVNYTNGGCLSYNTNDDAFYNESFERTHDTLPHLEMLMSNDPDKFEGCIIEEK